MFMLGEWVRTSNGRTGWIENMSFNSVKVIFADTHKAEWLPIQHLKSHEAVLPGIRQELTDMALEARYFDWFKEG